MGLIILSISGTILSKWSHRRLPLTIIIVILLIALALIAAPRLPNTNYTATYSQMGPAIALLTAAFTGLEIVTSHQRNLRRAADFPRALLLSSALAAVVGIGLAAATGPYATKVSGGPLVPLGEAIAGIPGSIAVLATGSIVLTLFLGWTLGMATRHLYQMSQDGFWPAWLCHTHPKRGAPSRIIFVIGILAMSMVWIPSEFLGRLSGLLYLLVLMAINLTLARRPRQNVRPSSFSLPFHPWIPALTLAVDALLIVPVWGLVPAICVLGCLVVGIVIYLLYGQSRHIEAQNGITVFRPPTHEYEADRFHVLVPIANPTTASALLRVAGRLAQFQGGSVLALQVVTVPESIPLETRSYRAETERTILEKALAIANEEKLPIQTITRVAHSVAQGILDTAIEGHANLIVLGWGGLTHSRGASLGKIADVVLRDAPCDVLVVRGEHAEHIEKILVPTAGGTHARAAARLATLLMKALRAKVTFLYVQSKPATAKQTEENRRRIAETIKGLAIKPPPEEKVVVAPSVAEGIIQEAQEHDLVLLGVSDETLLDQLVFGNVPLQVAARVPHTALVQGNRGLTGLWRRRLLRTLRGKLPTLDAEEQLELRQELGRGAQPGTNFFVLTILSCIIAALGLLIDSPAIVIGAMLVAPLMSPIMAFSLGLITGNLRIIRFAVEAILKGIALVVIITAFIGLISPLKNITHEMLNNGQPTLLDMGVALVAGMAGAYALARKDVSAALPGVAIAAALTPPLATAGLSLAMGDPRVAGGAFLLFLANIAAISLAAGIVFLLLGVRPQGWGPEHRRRLRWRLAASLLSLLAIAIPLGIIMAGIVQDTAREQTAREIIAEYLETEDSQLTSLVIEESGIDLVIVATIQSAHPLEQEIADELADILSDRLRRPVQLEAVVLPVVRSTPISAP
jgi:uncharacterized hydrophobic protein (TIGR00271 family)